MSLKTIACAVALSAAAAACTQTPAYAPPMAQVQGDKHVIVRAEYGHLWWAHNTQSEPHQLWHLPARGEVENLAVASDADGFIVTFEQGGTQWSGRFGQRNQGRELARREP